AGVRAVAYLALASGFFVLAGWPSTEVSLSVVALVIGLGAVSPNPQVFTIAAFIAAPIAAVLAGTLEFLILDGVTEFPLLALALAPFMIGAIVAATSPHPMVASLGRLNLIFILVILSPSNPQSYNANSFLFVILFLCTGIGLLLAAQTLIPPESSERRQRWIMASVRRDFGLVLSKHDRRLAPEEAMFRDATRIGQIPASGASHRDSAVLTRALSYFDRAAAIRLCRVSLARLAETSLSHLAAEAHRALDAQDTQRLRNVSLALKDGASAESALREEVGGELSLAAVVIDAAAYTAAPAKETVS
ncbi:MAG: FUSC family protein, partial [Methylobacteriaceae bacterium]|nr:FUSC family protein [Methylobacteriaceae bacterium]